MTYQVIARKWRPQTFEEVTGQEHITRTLRNAVEHERLHHAYLFSGARGVGKTTTARILAKAVNCHKSPKPTATPCRIDDPDACASCRDISEGRSPDVREIDAASNTGVDSVRDVIIDKIGVAAANWEGRERYRVFIIDEVHMLSTSAFNALLKTLEEPPPRVLFIMATTHPHKVPETILSRSQQFEFRTIAAAKIAERLRYIAGAEKIKVSDEALREIARAGEGSMRDAQSAFDQVISFGEGEIEASDVEAALGIAGAEMLARVVRAVAEERPAEALAVVEELSARGHDLRNFCRDLLAYLRDLLVFKVAGESAMADATEAERRGLQAQAREFSESDIVRFFHSLTETETQLRDGAHPRYQLEVGLVKLVEMRRLAPLGQIVERLSALEESLRTGRAPAGGGAGQQTPPASPANLPPRRGMAGGGGASSFSPRPQVRVDAKAHDAPAASNDEGARADASPSLKLVPAPAQSSGGAPSFSAGAASRADDAPFALSEGGAAKSEVAKTEVARADGFDSPRPFFEETRAGVDRVGQPVALAPATRGGAAAAAPAQSGDARGEACDEAGRIKRALEERGKPLLAVALEGARRVRLDGEEVRIEFAPEAKHLYDTLRKSENQKLLREACCEVLSRGVGLKVTMRTPGDAEDEALSAEDEARREQKRLRERAEAHPVVQKVLKTFRAEIVDVRPTEGAQQ